MDPSLFALAALILIPAIQVPAVLYVSRYVEVDGDDLPDVPSGYTDPPSEWGLDEGESESGDDHEKHDDGPVSVPDRVACARCGVENEATYTYCWACTARLA